MHPALSAAIDERGDLHGLVTRQEVRRDPALLNGHVPGQLISPGLFLLMIEFRSAGQTPAISRRSGRGKWGRECHTSIAGRSKNAVFEGLLRCQNSMAEGVGVDPH